MARQEQAVGGDENQEYREESSVTPDKAAPKRQTSSLSETIYYLGFGALTLLLASVPYIYGWRNTPPDHVYTGLTYNIDDGAVYLSWMRQALEGHFFIHNRFAIEPQRDLLFNLFFWLLGTISRFTGLDLIVVYQAARVVCGGLLLWAVAALLKETLAPPRGRMAAFALVCIGSGIGWLFPVAVPENGPIDLWQPEAITFLSLYYTPLFVAATALMVVFVLSALRWERGGGFGALWPAMVSGALLGNFHSYDILHLFAVWIVYRVISDVTARQIGGRGWIGLIVAGVAALPTAGYQAWVLRVDPVFYQRAFVSNTLTPPLWQVICGYGLLLPLGIAAIAMPKRTARFTGSGDALRLLATWAVVALAIAYVPVSFQRKLIMGAHIPWAILAGAGLAALTERLSGDFPKIATAALIALTAPSNAIFLTRDIGRLQSNVGSTPHRPYLTDDESAALGWLRTNAQHNDVVLVGPDPTSHLRFPGFALWPHLSVYVPALSGCVVYDGHWSETPDFGKKLGNTKRFFQADTDDASRRDLLAANNIRYVLLINALGDGPLKNPDGSVAFAPVPWPHSDVPPYLEPVYQNTSITIYAVRGLTGVN